MRPLLLSLLQHELRESSPVLLHQHLELWSSVYTSRPYQESRRIAKYMNSRFCFFRRCLLVVAGGGSVACRPQGVVEALSSRPCVRYFMERCVTVTTGPRSATMKLKGSKPSSRGMEFSAAVALRRGEGSSRRWKKGARAAGFLNLETVLDKAMRILWEAGHA
jgi:hypothetical protein